MEHFQEGPTTWRWC